jgi:hypothetical protein
MDRESRETWSKRIERWKDGGLTAKIVLPSSLRIRVPSGFDVGALRRLLEVLDARR